jgi:Glycosyl hydrolase family 12
MRRRKLIVCLSGFCVACMLLACRPRRPTSVPAANLPGLTAQCGGGAILHDGPYNYENNQWGSHKAHGHFEQCLLLRTVDGHAERGWSWDFPGTDRSVFAYPEIIFGWKPWSGGRSSDARFPLKLSAMQKLDIEYDVETDATGSYNLAPEVWLIRQRPSAGQPNPSAISAEIMFWVEAAGVAQPGGSLVERPEINGQSYELWQQDNAGGDGSGPLWRLLSFKTPATERKGTIPVADLLRYLVKKGLVNAEHYVAGVEFGNEISGGRGTTWVKNLKVEVSP